jgi:hypothetical protein
MQGSPDVNWMQGVRMGGCSDYNSLRVDKTLNLQSRDFAPSRLVGGVNM